MEQEKIRILLSRFYEGLTTDEEEAALRDYFGSAPPEDDAGIKLLLSYRNETVPEPSAGFAERLAHIPHEVQAPRRLRKAVLYSLSAAAGIALLTGSYFAFRAVTADRMKDSFQDPELAMAEVREILLNVSQNMKRGTEPLNSMSTLGIIPGALKDLGKMNMADDGNLDKLRYLNDMNAQGNDRK